MTVQNFDDWLFDLYVENAGLAVSGEAIRGLIDICKNESEVEVVKHILNEIDLISKEKFQNTINLMALRLGELSKQYHNMAIVAACYDNDADSSQYVLHKVKAKIPYSKKIAYFNSVPTFLKKITSYDGCIIIDEFSGTGNTIINRVKHIKSDAKFKKHTLDVQSFVCFAMSKAVSNIKSSGSKIEVIRQLKAGLSGYFHGEQLEQKIENMKRLENELATEVEGKELQSLGYGQAEAKYCVEEENAPNSNFPILWWPKTNHGDVRKTVFTRNKP